MIAPIVSPEWLQEHYGEVVICDVRTTMGGGDPQAAYRGGHLPGARFVDLDADLADPPAAIEGRHPLPTAERFASALGHAGIADDDVVVAYDIGPGGFAARLVWMLRVIGREAALLDGGLASWDGVLDRGPAPTTAAPRTAVPWPANAIADADDVARHLDRGGVVADSRETARYRGEIEPIDTVAGHIPGAINLPFGENLVGGRFRPAEELRARFAPLVTDPDAIVYCGSGVTACHNALAAEAAGLARPRVYVGSWSGWSTDASRPLARAD